ncbi:MAG TPA: peptidylprolyl isomerase [Thermoguttaceae bacterium]|nr:peptidylprolyl isomerase [Thermoguttaceae bacterium]
MNFPPFRRRNSRRSRSTRRALRWTGGGLRRFEPLEERHLLAAPVLGQLPAEVTVLAGAPLHVALDGFDADGDDLTYTATVQGNNDLQTFIPQGNRNLRISVAGFGDMLFELFEGRAPDATARIIELAESGFYDGLIFHRVIDGFMIQGGDPQGTGSGGSGVKFDDQFHPDLQHTASGMLSLAKNFDDTNDSQFFVTDAATRWLDFQHSIIGFLTEGATVRDAISAVPETNDRPNTPVVMQSVTVEPGGENGVLMLSAPEGTTGDANVTITVSDGQGGTAQRTVHVVIQADTQNANPYIDQPIADLYTTGGQPVGFTISGTDVDMQTNGDALWYGAWNRQDWGYVPNEELEVEIDPETGQGTVTALDGLAGVQGILVGVNPRGLDYYDYRGEDPRYYSPGYSSGWDFQIVPLIITPGAPSAVQLISPHGPGPATGLDNTPGKPLKFSLSGVADGAEVTLYADGIQIGQAVASGHTVEITTNETVPLSEGTREITVRQAMYGQALDVGNNGSGTIDLVGDVSGVLLTVVVDQTAPQFEPTDVDDAVETELFTHDVQTDDETAGKTVSYNLSDPPAGARIDPATGLITWVPAPGQGPSKTLTVVATDAAGNQASRQIEVQIAAAAPIDFLELTDRFVVEREELYFQPVRNGWFSVEATFSNAAGNVNLFFYDSGGALLDSSLSSGDVERVDAAVSAGETYKLVVLGDNPNVSYVLCNLLDATNDSLMFYGTDGDDTFEVVTGALHEVIINGLAYDNISAGAYEMIAFDGLAGNDTVAVTGSATDDIAILSPGKGELIGWTYEISWSNVASAVVVGGGGRDIARLFDSPGDDRLVSGPAVSELSGDGFSNRVEGFAAVRSEASGGYDIAKLSDANRDECFVATPSYATMLGDTFANEALNFDQVHGYATRGNDVAKLFDSPGDDHFAADPLQGVLSGNGYYNRAKGFDAVHAYSTAGGFDSASLVDSAGDDTFVGNPTYGALYNETFYVRAKLFDTVEARADAGGNDIAYLYDSAGADLFVATSTSAVLSGPGFSNRAKRFETVEATADAGGRDVAKLFDSPGNDKFVSFPDSGEFSGEGFDNWAFFFERVHAYSDIGGVDAAEFYDSFGDDTFTSNPTEAALSGDGFYSRAKHFETVDAWADAGGYDVADLYDSPGDDTFVAMPDEATFYGEGFEHWVGQFDLVRAHADAGGYDVADLYDSPGKDTFVATPTIGRMFGEGFELQALRFDEVRAHANNDGRDVAKLFDSPGDDTFDANSVEGVLYGTGFYNWTELFEQVHAYATAGGHDVANLFDSAGNDRFDANPTQGALSGIGFYNRAKLFEEVYASATAGGEDEAYLNDSDAVDLLEADGNWVRLSNAALDFLFEAGAFDFVKATATTEGDIANVGVLESGLTLELNDFWQSP